MLTNLFKYWTYRFFAPDAALRTTYEAFQDLLAFDSRCHEIMADLESLYYQGKKEDFCKISLLYDSLARNVQGMVESLEKMTPDSYVSLQTYFHKFNFYSRFFLSPPPLQCGEPFILQFTDKALSPELAGAKTSTLVQLACDLNLAIPSGFVITTNCFSYLIEHNNLRPTINSLLGETDLTSITLLSEISAKIIQLIREAEIPPDVISAIRNALKIHHKTNDPTSLFAVRSSALCEDGRCSFAGQYSSYLHIKPDNLINAYINVICSKYSPEVLAYRINSGLSDEETPMAVLILSMVDAAAAGVIYTADPSTKQSDKLSIHSTIGLGDSVVSGTVTPEVFTVHKKNHHISTSSSQHDTLTKNQVLTLSKKALTIEHHFGKPQDIEWAMQKDGSFIFLQSRELHLYPQPKILAEVKTISTKSLLFSGGVMAASGTTCSKAWCLDSKTPLDTIDQGSILIIRETLPSYVRILHLVSGVVAELGSAAGHFATVCREFGVPLLLGVGKDIHRIHHGQLLTLSADNCAVYSGDQSHAIKTIPIYKRDQDLPFFKKLRSVLEFVAPLTLLDPQSNDFTPESCRSLHDIIRFSHEMAVQTMFSIGDRYDTIKGGKKKLQTQLPFEVFLVDVDEGLDKSASALRIVTVDQIRSVPFQALWCGLNHADVSWEDQVYYNWKGYDRQAMSDAFAFQSNSDSASYAVVGKDYLNMNIRFGYHFTVIDALCEPDVNTSYCTLRFAGGGGDFEGRELRISFLTKILDRLGFDVTTKGDLLDARISGISADNLVKRIESLGRLLGVTKQMDMRLNDIAMVEQLVENFFQTL